MTREDSGPRDVAALLTRCEVANEMLLNGDVHGFRALIPIAEDYTLMSPFGGTPTHARDLTEEVWNAIGQFFHAGTGRFELVASYAVPEMVVLVVIERQTATVGSLPEQDWSLRVTLVFCLDAGRWRLVHRHADPLVPRVPVERAAALARG